MKRKVQAMYTKIPVPFVKEQPELNKWYDQTGMAEYMTEENLAAWNRIKPYGIVLRFVDDVGPKSE